MRFALIEGPHREESPGLFAQCPRCDSQAIPEHAAIEKVAQDGIAAIERGEFTIISGRNGSRALLERLNERALTRKIAGARQRG